MMKRSTLLTLCFFSAAKASYAAPVELVDEMPVEIRKVESDVYWVDFGRVAFGNLRLLPPENASGPIMVHFGEAAFDGRINREPPGTVRYNQTTVNLEGGLTVVAAPPPDKRNTNVNHRPPPILTPDEWGVILPFRWVEIEGWEGELRPEQTIRQSAFPLGWDDEAASFESSSELLNRIWELCRYSMKATSFAGVYVDGDRERIPYEADAYLNQLSHYYTDHDKQMARDTFNHLMEHPTWPTEWEPHMVFVAYTDWMHTGDKKWLAENFDSLKSKLLMERRGEDNLIASKRGQKRPDIVDWPPTERDGFVFTERNTVVNAFHLRALEYMQRMARVLDRPGEAAEYAALYDSGYAAFQSTFFDEDAGLYRDGVDTDHISFHANMFPLAFELVPEENRAAIADWLAERGMRCSVYAAQYFMEALFENGADEKAVELMLADNDRSWRHMVESGTTITWEAWDQKYKPNQDWNHAWGAAPANLLPRYLLGVEPLSPGWKQARIRPYPAGLASAEGTVPTPLGPIRVEWTDAESFSLKLEIPAGMTARVELPADGPSLGVLKDNKAWSAVRTDNRWVIDSIGAGTHRFTVFGASAATAPAKELTVSEGFVNPIGLHDAEPTFSWKLPEGVKKQTAYRIQLKDEAILWDSGWVASDQSVFVPYEGPALSSRQRLFWRVNYKDENEAASGWSEPAHFEPGLLGAEDWQAQWIRYPKTEAATDSEEPVTWLRKEFSLSDAVVSARLYVTARGLYQVSINGQRVGDDAFAPGWTAYEDRIETRTYDVTGMLDSGEQVIGALLGTGWYAGKLAWENERHFYGEEPQLLLQLEIEHASGKTQTIVSDGTWTASRDGPIRSSSIYDGEHYEARHETPGWGTVGFDDSTWKLAASDADLGAAALVPKSFPPVRVTEELPVQAITEPSPGRFVFNLGQNIVGWVRIEVPAEKDQTITMRFAEMLNPDGSMHTENYRSARSTNTYLPAETGMIEWQPTFTFHGYQYVELSGLPEGVRPEKEWVKGLVLHSDLQRIGSFRSSHAKLDQLQSNIVWGQRGNFLDIPTDCPQRDERLGWTGDAQVFCPTAMFNYDSHAFWKSWLQTMRNEQFEDGRIPHVIPDIRERGGSPGWMDAATIIPWDVYVRTGDPSVLAENYAMMEQLVGWYSSQSEDHLIPEIGGFGDWLQPHSERTRGDTPRPLLGSAFYARSVQLLAQSAEVLGKHADLERYAEEAAAARKAFGAHYFDAGGKLQNAPETQTAYILALQFNLVPDALREKVGAHLLRLIDEADGHLRTGFLGTPHIAPVLDQIGHPELALELLFKESYPSWFYSINQGATTMWERWNSYTKKDGFSGDGMNSLNHYAYGAIGQWMYERVAGLAPDPAHPGYKHFFVRPLFASQLNHAEAALDTPYGRASTGWKREDEVVVIDVVVPPNTTATIEFPNGRKSETVEAGMHSYELEL